MYTESKYGYLFHFSTALADTKELIKRSMNGERVVEENLESILDYPTTFMSKCRFLFYYTPIEVGETMFLEHNNRIRPFLYSTNTNPRSPHLCLYFQVHYPSLILNKDPIDHHLISSSWPFLSCISLPRGSFQRTFHSNWARTSLLHLYYTR